jgi:dipeptidyl aminopeptidase/acylaminoacyl peptidase
MRSSTALLTLALLAATDAAAQQAVEKRPITHEDVYTMKRVSSPRPSPDGRWVVFSVNEPSYEPAKAVSDLWIVPADGSAGARRLTSTRTGESGVAWAPDSRRIAFSARRDGDDVEQIYVLDLAGGEAQRVTSMERAAANPQWRPDGQAILFESLVRRGIATAGKSTARVYDAMPVRFWNQWSEATTPHLFVQELSGGSAVDLLAGSQLAASPGFDGPYAGEGAERSLQARWAPDGREVVFIATVNKHLMMTEDTEAHLFRVARGAEPQRITAAGQSVERPSFTPDGKALLVRVSRAATAAHPYSLTRLARIDWPSGQMRLLTEGFDRSVGEYHAARDGSGVVFAAEDAGFSKLFRVALSGGAVKPLFEVREGGYSSPFHAGPGLIATYSSSTQPTEIVRVDEAQGTHALLTDFNRETLAALDLPKPEHFWFTARNGKRIHSVIVFPPRLDKNRRYPLVVNPHGGPNSMSADSFSTRWNYHLLTADGYVLLMTNYTGSTGFGERFADDIERDVLRGPAQEILEAAEEAARRYPFIDRTRQAAMGASYGGYLMNWFNGHTDQFRCLVIHAGASNNESQYGVNDGGWGRELRMGAPVWESGKGQWMDQSPFRYASAWKTPALITQGELDFRVPLNESIATFKLLQRQKVPARLVVYPDEGHWILKGENARHHMQEVRAWLKRYLEPGGGVSAGR